MTTVRRRAGEKSGQAAIELAMTLPVLFIILAMVVGGGMMVHTAIRLTEAAANGARAVQDDEQLYSTANCPLLPGSLCPSYFAAACSAVRSELGLPSGGSCQTTLGNARPTEPVVVVSPQGGTPPTGSQLTVTVEALVPFPLILIGQPPVSAQAVATVG